MNYTKTHPSHFGYIPEMPKEEDYRLGDSQYIKRGLFLIKLKEWQSKYGEEPKPVWINFEDRYPEITQKIYAIQYGHLIKDGYTDIVSEIVYRNTDTVRYKDVYHAWCDAKEHDEHRALWNYHQKKYSKQWTAKRYDKNIINCTNGKHNIFFDSYFHTMEILEINDIEDKLIYQGEILDITTLEGICKSNEIEL